MLDQVLIFNIAWLQQHSVGRIVNYSKLPWNHSKKEINFFETKLTKILAKRKETQNNILP